MTGGVRAQPCPHTAFQPVRPAPRRTGGVTGRVTEGGGLPDGLQERRGVVQGHGSLRDLMHFVFVDHGFLRLFWHNTSEIAPGVWRSNQPDLRRLRRWKRTGIRSVISLRGDRDAPYARMERAACADLGLSHSHVRLRAIVAPRREVLLDLLALFRTVERPFVMHCKSGADRTGLAATLYLIAFEGQPVWRARRQLSLRYMHARWTRAGIIDHFFDSYEQRRQRGMIGIEDWIAREYDPAMLSRSFAHRRQGA